ncbi:hypothetical protein [Wukongibacter baidiensis]
MKPTYQNLVKLWFNKFSINYKYTYKENIVDIEFILDEEIE